MEKTLGSKTSMMEGKELFMDMQFDDIYIVRDKKTGLLVLDEDRYVEKNLWYRGYTSLYYAAKELSEKWCIQFHYDYKWYADSDAGTDRQVSGSRTCPVGCETVITEKDGDLHAKISIYVVGDGQECIGFLQKVSGYHDTDEWHFFDLNDPETHAWTFGKMVLSENAEKDHEHIW